MHPEPGHPGPAPADSRLLEDAFAAELAALRGGDLLQAYRAALPGARAAVLARLWRAMQYEALPGLDLGRLHGPRIRSHDVGAPKDEFTVRLDGRPYVHPAELLSALALPGAEGFVAELDHSVASLALSRAGATRRPGESLVAYEQSVVDGHPYHPCCRSRPGFTVADQLAYAPEHRPVVQLGLVPLPVSECRLVGDWPDSLRDDRGRVLLPVHPWQLREVLPTPAGHGGAPDGAGPVGAGQAGTGQAGAGLPGSVAGPAAHPLMAVRTLAPVRGGLHLKTSLSLRMTSSVRDISGGSVIASAPLSDLLAEVTGRLDGSLLITRNLAAAAALTGTDHRLSADLAVLLRESPEVHTRPGERVLPLAAIDTLPDDPVHWLDSLARLAWPPLLRLLSWGVALEAHGQNLLVVLDHRGRPQRLVYRDLADVRVSRLRLAALGLRPTEVLGHVLDDDPVVLRRKLFGSLLGGTFSSLVAQLGGGVRAVEDRLWAAVAAAAADAAAVLAPEDRNALLQGPLPVKALSRMRLAGPPGDQWTLLPNPLLPRSG
jgi:siderophore synthetase component